MRNYLYLALLAALPFFSSCATNTTCDARGPYEVCEVHHEYMDTVIVANERMPQPSQAYLDARAKLFPHSYPYILPIECKRCVVYFCKDCVREEKEWRRRHSVTK